MVDEKLILIDSMEITNNIAIKNIKRQFIKLMARPKSVQYSFIVACCLIIVQLCFCWLAIFTFTLLVKIYYGNLQLLYVCLISRIYICEYGI